MSAFRRRREDGAVALVAGVSAVALIGMAALVVDLGNAFVERRDIQAQADFAALAAGADLPGTKTVGDDAVDAAAEYLTSNGFANSPTVTPGLLVDGNELNGEVYFPNDTTIRVMAPVSRVHFGLAAVVGLSYVDINAEATVGIRSPGRPLPFFLPRDCTSGAVELKDSSNNSNTVSFNPAPGNGNGIASVDGVQPLTTPGLTASDITLFGTNFTPTMATDFHQESTSDRVPAATASSFPATRTADTPSDKDESDQAVVTLPPGVFNRPGPWLVRVDNGNGYSRTVGRFVVGNPTPPPAGCGVSSTGDFGMLDSPRSGITQLADATALNIAKGLDHDLDVFKGTFPDDTIQDPCQGNGGTPPPGAQNDIVSQPGNNCVGIKTGMNTDTVTTGLVTGGTANGDGFDGLLETETTSGCDPDGGSAERSIIGTSINNDVLSCFLAPGVTVGQVTAASVGAAKHSIHPDIFSSPRFATVPVINYKVNPQNGYYPILSWQPVFITDESNASTKGGSFATSRNGVTVSSSSGNKVVALTVVPINPEALPETANASGPSIPYTGTGTRLVRLID